MDKYDIRAVQEKILSVFVEIDKVCEKYNFQYFAIGGTCIGAVRHNGFIPWDDDLDIAMPRGDYEKFLDIADSELPENLRVLRPENCEHYECIFSKVQDIRTTFIQKNIFKYPDRYTGVYVDIMPLDGLPDDRRQRKKHFKRLQFLGDLNINRRRDSRDIHKGIKELFWRQMKHLLDRKEFDAFYLSYTEQLKRYDFETSKETSYAWCDNRHNLVFPKSDFADYITLPFENFHMRCPAGYDDFLTRMFGDYMKLPPKEQQVPIHPALIDLTRPFRYYQEKGVLDG